MNQVNKLLHTIGTAGQNPDGSYTRSLYSPAYFQAVDIVDAQMQSLGMTVTRDAAGNIHGVLPGTDPEAKSIIIGSHLDTVPSGGLFDGAYGVAGGLSVVAQLLQEGKKLRHTLEIYGFNGEESNPLGGTFGSRAVAGQVNQNQLGLADALAIYGHNIDDILACKRDFSNAKCYLELHIEQGDYLFNEHRSIGVVNGIVGIVRYNVVANGHSNHAGTTMMANRQDALVAMSKLIVASDACCRTIDDTLVLTVGTIDCHPGSENVIPGRVSCTFEMRHMNPEKTDILIEKIRQLATQIDGVDFAFTKKIDKGSVGCDPHLMEVIGAAATGLNLDPVVMPSGAGHDANPMAHLLPIGMIFIPSRDGLSHCGEEWSEESDLVHGADVLYETVLKLDQE